MKEGWTYKKLGEVCELYQPKTISMKEMVADGKYDVFGANGVIGKYNKYNHEHSEILMTCRGATCGNINLSTPKSWINGNAMVIHIKDESLIDKSFLVYSLSFVEKKDIITGAAQPQITRQTLAPLGIFFPPLPEQQRIVSRLDSAFAHIDELKANAEKQVNEARALFQKALTKAMEPKEGWEGKKLGELGELKNGMNFAHNEKGYDMFLLGVGDFGNRFSIDNVEQLSMISLNQKPSEDYMLIDGDIVFVRSNGNKQLVGRSVIVYPNETPVTFSGFCIRFRRNTSIINERFLVSFLKSEGTRKKLFGNGANISNLNQGMLQDLMIPLPPLFEQQRIVSRLDSLSAHVRELEEVTQKTIAECDALKQALLRKVFE